MKIGVCIQPDTTGPMQHIAKAIAALAYLGIGTVRIRAPIAGSDSYKRIYVPLAKAGIRFLFTHAPGKEPAGEIAAIKSIDDINPGCVIGIEGPNEPDLNPVSFGGLIDHRLGVRTGNGKAAIALQKAIFTEARKVFRWQDVDVVAFNDWMHTQQMGLDGFANSHIYPNGTNLAPKVAGFNKLVTALGKSQGYITEWGYTNGAGAAFKEISEAQAALNFAADIKAINANQKIKRAFIYTLVDYIGEGEQQRFGLFNDDWTPKPAANEVRKAILK